MSPASRQEGHDAAAASMGSGSGLECSSNRHLLRLGCAGLPSSRAAASSALRWVAFAAVSSQKKMECADTCEWKADGSWMRMLQGITLAATSHVDWDDQQKTMNQGDKMGDCLNRHVETMEHRVHFYMSCFAHISDMC